MKNIKKYNRGVTPAVLIAIFAVVIAVGAGAYYYFTKSQTSIPTTADSSLTSSNPFGQTDTQDVTRQQSNNSVQTTQNVTPKLPTSTPPVVTNIPTASKISCTTAVPVSMVQNAYPGKTVTYMPNQPTSGALLANCGYRVTGSGTLSVKLFDTTQESSYNTTVNQLSSQGYKCTAIDSAVGFPASSCGLAAGSVIIDIVVFSTTSSKYAVMITGTQSPTSLYALAKAVNSSL